MQISLNIQDDVYQKLVHAGAYFQQALEDIESGKTQVISHSDVWDKIEKYTNK